MSLQDRDLLAGRGVPDARSVVVRAGDDAVVVAEGGGIRRPAISLQDRDLLAGRGVPDARSVLSSPRAKAEADAFYAGLPRAHHRRSS
jgi:hypothetical protein